MKNYRDNEQQTGQTKHYRGGSILLGRVGCLPISNQSACQSMLGQETKPELPHMHALRCECVQIFNNVLRYRKKLHEPVCDCVNEACSREYFEKMLSKTTISTSPQHEPIAT